MEITSLNQLEAKYIQSYNLTCVWSVILRK